MRRWLVLVAAPAGLLASWPGDWSVCYELRSVSARDDHVGSGMTCVTPTWLQNVHAVAMGLQRRVCSETIQKIVKNFEAISGV